jgi:fumarate hydratase, class I
MAFKIDDFAFQKSLLELIRRASTQLPVDILDALRLAFKNEDDSSPAHNVLAQILENIELANKESTPICQDTGTSIYYVKIPVGISMKQIEKLISAAVVTATEKSYLRPNAVDSVSGKNTGNNLGTMAPYIHFDEWEKNAIEVKLLLKGGGSENVSGQYKLPDSTLKAGRNLDGVYKCVIDAVNKAQGLGCAPGFLGIGIGGDRASGMIIAKQQLFRKVQDNNPDSELAKLEKRLLSDINTLGIGPMGFGGKTTAFGVKIGTAHRLPASFFVSIAYMCWANRRAEMLFSADNKVKYD